MTVAVSILFSARFIQLTLPIHGQFELPNWSISAKYFLEMVLVDVLGELFHHDLDLVRHVCDTSHDRSGYL
jgi:hypothetical protein